jgi:hypothetical protein
MTDFLSKFRSGEIIGLVAIVCSFLFVISPIIAFCWYKIHKNSTAAALKQDMLNRGMSAEEIKIVLEAGTQAPARCVRNTH